MIDLTEHFIVKQKSILKHQKLVLQDVTLGAWVLKNPLIGKEQSIRWKIAPSPPLNRETAYLSLASFAFHRLIGYNTFPNISLIS